MPPLPDATVLARASRDRLSRLIAARLLAGHPDTGGRVCTRCRQTWPCPPAALALAVLHPARRAGLA
jgi:hypothetical protein